MDIRSKLRSDWYHCNHDLTKRHCQTFNKTTARYQAGKEPVKTQYSTWGACCRDCLRHLGVIGKGSGKTQ